MKIKIIANNPPFNSISIEDFIGQVFDAYSVDNDMLVMNPVGRDFIVFDGEYEVIEP